MRSSLDRLKKVVTEASSQREFRHNPWYVSYHLELVETISHELLEAYPEADEEVVLALAWIHDYGKIIDSDNEYRETLEKGPEALKDAGYDDLVIDRIIGYVELLDKADEIDIRKAPIEVQIVSSADGCSHLVGPFFYFWWWENPQKTYEELMSDNRRKLAKDWDRKIVLAEARKAFEARYQIIREQVGFGYPDRFISASFRQD